MSEPGDSHSQADVRPFGPLGMLGVVLAVALFGAVSGLHVLQLLAGHGSFLVTTQIERLVPHQSVLAAPVPAGYVDLQRWIDWLALFGTHAAALTITLLSALGAGLAIISVLHPHLLTQLREGRVAVSRLVIAILGSVGVLVAALWELPAPVMRTHYPYDRAFLAGGLLWLFWHRRGWLHEKGVVQPLREIAWQVLCGGVVGLAAHAYLRHLMTPTDYAVLDQWLEHGYWSRTTWRELGLFAIGRHAWGGLLVGTLACFLGQSGTRLRPRIVRVLPAAALIVLLFALGWVWLTQVWFSRYGYGVLLQQQLPAPKEPQAPPELLIVLDTPGNLPVRVALGRTVEGLPTTLAVDRACRDLLKRTRAETCSATSAYVQLHDSAAWRWDTDARLQVQLDQLATPTATPIFASLLCETLERSADTPSAEAALARLLEPRQFATPKPMSRDALARLAWRWGRLDALAARRDPGDPKLLATLRQQRPPRRDGIITGRLHVAGKPWPGVRVGLLPKADLPALVGRAPAVLPFEQRLVAVSTVAGADGSFRLERLFDDEYVLVVRCAPSDLPPAGSLASPTWRGPVRLGASRVVELGTINIIPGSAPPPPSEKPLQEVRGPRNQPPV